MANRVVQLFASYDRTSEMFGPLFPADHVGVAIRSFSDAILRPGEPSDLSNHPDHFELFHVGEWNHSTGELVPSLYNKPVVTGTQISSKSA